MGSHLMDRDSPVYTLPKQLQFTDHPTDTLPFLDDTMESNRLFSSPDLEDSFNASTEDVVQSPINFTRLRSPRKTLRSRARIRLNDEKFISPESNSPPYKRVRALNLFDSPQSPKSLLQNSSAENNKFAAIRTPVRSFTPTRLFSTNSNTHSTQSPPRANVNPFTPTGMMINSGNNKRQRAPKTNQRFTFGDMLGSFEEFYVDDDCDEQPVKKIALSDSNISRYQAEFHELGIIGSGQFGSVYKCINRLDGCEYALKKSLRPIAGSLDEQTALNEVYAHAVLGKHQHVVRYYSAWAEEKRMVIQNEYCNGGSLADAIVENERTGRNFSENELKIILLQVAEGLKYIHSNMLAHLDIKPGNIFISRNVKPQFVKGDSDDGFDEEDECDEVVTYKIGDLGHVTSLTNPQVEEGDCRYLPCEILQDNFEHLTKVDIFALGLTIYEAGGGGPLPKNGDEWHDIRNDRLPPLERYSSEFNALIKEMVRRDPVTRPSAAALSHHRVLCPSANKSKAQLRKELNAERLKNELLSRQLQEAAKSLKGLMDQSVLKGTEDRFVGKKTHRSHSVTTF